VVTVTANHTAPAQLATMRWDDEGVVPPEATLVKNGVLQDFQTTREQATWLAPYYQRAGRTVTSNGCAIGKNGLHLPLQMRPNLALTPSSEAAPLSALITSVKDGILVEDGAIQDVDVQARNGVLQGTMHRITGGKVTYPIENGAVRVNTLDFWKNVQAVGDASTAGVYSATQYGATPIPMLMQQERGDKGRPLQRTSYSAQGVAAVVANQAVFDPMRKA
jgi:TldD protein